jgi:3-hydroxyacyl-[acyl-carrier-protein] dehydratase
MGDEAERPVMDIHAVMAQLPHRYPFLLIDRVLEASDEHLVALKQVTINEPFFSGHFPHRPVMPGVMIIEALAQATGLLAFRTTGVPDSNTLYYICGIDKARFKRPVEPGDSLTLRVKSLRTVKNIWRFEAQAEVDGEMAAKAELMAARVEVGR